jgi:hypothetical protein
MRCFPLPLALAGLLGSASLAPAAALAYPNAGPTYAPLPVSPYGYNNTYGGYNSDAGRYPGAYGYPIASEPAPYAPPSVRSCNRGTVLTGAAIGGGLGAMLATNSRSRLWSLPLGAAMGGILGGVMSGC